MEAVASVLLPFIREEWCNREVTVPSCLKQKSLSGKLILRDISMMWEAPRLIFGTELVTSKKSMVFA